MSIRTLIVDDERLARLRILKLIEPYGEIEVIGESKNGNEAVELINSKKPDLIFLDIQMPDLNGFEVLSKVDLSFNPVIIFATAYDNYALKAFDVHAVDYLLKPFDADRFEVALERAKTYLQMRKSTEFNDKIINLMRDYYNVHSEFKTKFGIKSKGKKIEIYTDDIFYFESDGNYVNINLETQKYLYRITMNALEYELNSNTFLRIHRSLIINSYAVKTVRYEGENNKYRFYMKNGKELVSGRSYKDKIMEYLSSNPIL